MHARACAAAARAPHPLAQPAAGAVTTALMLPGSPDHGGQVRCCTGLESGGAWRLGPGRCWAVLGGWLVLLAPGDGGGLFGSLARSDPHTGRPPRPPCRAPADGSALPAPSGASRAAQCEVTAPPLGLWALGVERAAPADPRLIGAANCSGWPPPGLPAAPTASQAQCSRGCRRRAPHAPRPHPPASTHPPPLPPARSARSSQAWGCSRMSSPSPMSRWRATSTSACARRAHRTSWCVRLLRPP